MVIVIVIVIVLSIVVVIFIAIVIVLVPAPVARGPKALSERHELHPEAGPGLPRRLRPVFYYIYIYIYT